MNRMNPKGFKLRIKQQLNLACGSVEMILTKEKPGRALVEFLNHSI